MKQQLSLPSSENSCAGIEQENRQVTIVKQEKIEESRSDEKEEQTHGGSAKMKSAEEEKKKLFAYQVCFERFIA